MEDGDEGKLDWGLSGSEAQWLVTHEQAYTRPQYWRVLVRVGKGTERELDG